MQQTEAHPAAADAARRRSYEKRWWILGVLSVTLALAAMDTTIVNVAIPTLQQELDASSTQLQWIVDSYVIVFAGLLLTMGALGDRFGRRPLLQTGVAIFAAASLLAAFADSSEILMAARAITGIGAAMMMPATLSIIIDVFPRDEQPKAIAIWSAVAGISVPLGLILGGLLLGVFWWGSVFLINVPTCIFLILASSAIVPNSRDPNAQRVDIVGAALSIAMLSTLIFGIIEAASRGWGDALVLGAFAASAALAATFAAYELRRRFPMLDLRLFKSRRLSTGAAAMIASFLVMLGMLFLLTQYFQFARGNSALETGLLLIPFPLGFAFTSAASERAVVNLGTNRVCGAGLMLLAVALVALSFVTADANLVLVGAILAAIGAGGGMVMAPATVAMMESVPVANAGAGAALNEVTRLIGIALGVSILGTIASDVFRSELGSGVAGVPGAVFDSARDSVGAATQIATELGGSAGEALRLNANNAFIDAFGAASLVGAGVSLVAAVVVIWLMPSRSAPDLQPISPAALPSTAPDP